MAQLLRSAAASSTVQHIVLASRSPRRIELLAQIGITPEIIPADIDESPLEHEQPVVYVERLARAKATAVHERTGAQLVIAADTTVDVDGLILSQPIDEQDMRRMLGMLGGRSHQVHTGVAVLAQGTISSQVVTTSVTFHPMTQETLEWYIATGEPVGKAGSYAIQGLGGVLVAHIEGSMSNVVGLPLRESAILLGLDPLTLAATLD